MRSWRMMMLQPSHLCDLPYSFDVELFVTRLIYWASNCLVMRPPPAKLSVYYQRPIWLHPSIHNICPTRSVITYFKIYMAATSLP